MSVRVVPYDPGWVNAAQSDLYLIKDALGQIVVSADHIGSTAIPDIYAKPILDLLLEVGSLAALDGRSGDMQALGYKSMGEYGIPGRRFFSKSNRHGVRTHHVHSFENGHESILQHLVFRDYMITHPEEAEAYGQLKLSLAADHPDDIEAYMDGKDLFIKERITRAMAWRNNQPAR